MQTIKCNSWFYRCDSDSKCKTTTDRASIRRLDNRTRFRIRPICDKSPPSRRDVAETPIQTSFIAGMERVNEDHN